jgi:hypothetical protein
MGQKNREEVADKLMVTITESELSFFDLMGILEGIKYTLLIEQMGAHMPEVVKLWKEQAKERMVKK